MSGIRTVESLAFATLVMFGGACSKGVDIQNSKMPTPLATPVRQPTESGGTLFEQASCNKGEITFPKPMGWSILEVVVTPNLINCYASKGSLIREENFRNGLSISRLVVPLSDQERIGYARQLASQPNGRGLFPLAGTFKETREGSFTVFSGQFRGNSGNVYSEVERRIFVPDSSQVIYITGFTAPQPTAADDFKNFGRHMLDKIQIKVKPNI